MAKLYHSAMELVHKLSTGKPSQYPFHRPGGARIAARMGGKCQALAWGAVLLAAGWPCQPMAAPRDAIRNLPRLSHISSFETTSGNSAGQEFYSGVWRIDWLAADLRIGSASLRPTLSYSTTLSENLDRISGADASAREDRVNFRLDLRAPRLNGYAYLDQNDTTSSRSSNASEATDRVSQAKEVSLQWAGPPGTTLNARHNSSLVNEHLGAITTSASEVQTSSFGAQFDGKPRDALQSYRVQTTLTERDVYAPQRSSSSRRQTVFSGIRSLPLGKVGVMTLDWNYDETSSTLPGFDKEQTNSEGQYGVSLFGRVDKLPLDYNYNFHTVFRSYEQQPGEQVTTSDLQLTYVMPAPPGRSSSVNVHYSLQDYDGAAASNTSAKQTLRWSFAASPRLAGNVVLEHEDSSGTAAFIRGAQKDVVAADLRYGLSHNRGDISASFRQESNSDGASNSSTTTSAQLATGIPLGPQARLQFFFDQQNSQNRFGLFGETRSSDNIGNGFTYAFSSRAGLGLTATWRHTLLETAPAEIRNTADVLNVNLNYDSPAGWRYQLNLAANDTVKDSPIGGEHSYATESRIHAIVSYSF
jgi:hypothetical protein